MRLRIYGLAVGSRRRIVFAEDIKRLECHMKIHWRELVLRIREDSLQVQMKDEYFPQYSTPSGRTMTGGNGNGIQARRNQFFRHCCCPLTHCYTVSRSSQEIQTYSNKQASEDHTKDRAPIFHFCLRITFEKWHLALPPSLLPKTLDQGALLHPPLLRRSHH